MRSPLSITVLLLAFAPLVVAQDSASVNLADVARQTRAHAGTVAKSWDDQSSDFGRSTEDSGTPCGAPLAVQNGYVSNFIDKPLDDPELSKALVHWLDKHPDLDVVNPEDLARIKFPNTPAEAQDIASNAKSVADRWMGEASAASDPSERSATINTILNGQLRSNAGAILAQAVTAEQQRRVRSDGSPADKLQEAVNMYSICESRRQVQFEPDIEKLAKANFKKELAAQASSPAPAAEVAQGK